MANGWVEDPNFQSKEAFIVAEIGELAKKLGVKAHRVPVDIIIQMGELIPGVAYVRPDCVPFDPQVGYIDPVDYEPIEVLALVQEKSIPPLMFPETLGGFIKEETQRWMLSTQDVVLADGHYTAEPATPLEEIGPDDLLLLKAKEVIKDNAKMEVVYVVHNHSAFFALYVCRTTSCPNIWKEQYVLHELGLPVWLKAHPRIPLTVSGSATIPDFCGATNVVLSGTMEGADKVEYLNEPGSGPKATRTAKDPEGACRCYGLQAMVLRYCGHVFEPAIEPEDFLSEVDVCNFNFAWVLVGGTDPADKVWFAVSNDSVIESDGELTSGTIYRLSKVDILKVDLWMNDDYISHIFCGPTSPTPLGVPTTGCVPVSFAEKVKSFSLPLAV